MSNIMLTSIKVGLGTYLAYINCQIRGLIQIIIELREPIIKKNLCSRLYHAPKIKKKRKKLYKIVLLAKTKLCAIEVLIFKVLI